MAYFVEKRKLFKKTGDKLEKVFIEEGRFAKKDVIAFYFGAKWCSECEKFTPILKNFYNKIKAKKESFEVVYVSSDKTEDECKKFMLESHGDWFGLWMDESDEYGSNFKHMWGLREFCSVNGIPTLFAIKPDDEEMESPEGIKDILNKGEGAFEGWKNKSTGEENGEEQIVAESDIKPECCKITKYRPWVQTPPSKILEGLTLIKKTGKVFTEEPAEKAVGQFEIVAFYFSASWCGPCHNFTPVLKGVYEYAKSQNHSFEIVFISDDESEESMKEYMQELHGDWYGIFLKDERKKEMLDRMFEVQGIPTLAIVNKKGEKIVGDAVDEVNLKKNDVLAFWLQGKSATTEESASNQGYCSIF